MRVSGRDLIKAVARAIALLAVTPCLCSFALRARLLGRNRALEGSTQWLALVPGLAGQYLRRAFLRQALAACHETATIEFGTIFSDVRSRIDAHAYIGPRCHLGYVHVGPDVLIAAGVHVPSGARTHGFENDTMPIREQPGARTMVRIGSGSWIGSAAVIMADVGDNSVIGAGAVVTKALPAWVVAAGVPARIIRHRAAAQERTA